MKARYKHTNIVARDWQSLARFYEETFCCVFVPPERHLSGPWLEKGTGVPRARLSGVHLMLPGHGDSGPTLEIYQYSQSEARPVPAANREGFAHIAFEVDDVQEALAEVLQHGGRAIGDISSHEVAGVGMLSFVYAADPEGNIIELQCWGDFAGGFGTLPEGRSEGRLEFIRQDFMRGLGLTCGTYECDPCFDGRRSGSQNPLTVFEGRDDIPVRSLPCRSGEGIVGPGAEMSG